jgi:GNAT superfamily N-acetyltransferase
VVDGYTLVAGTPPVAAYLRLRLDSGLSPKTEAQAVAALAGSWWGCHVVHDESGDVVAMGRVIGDGGWYFHIADMATLPGHQRRGLGDLVMGALLERIREQAPGRAYLSLFADPPGRKLYARHGFVEDSDRSIGMARWLE